MAKKSKKSRESKEHNVSLDDVAEEKPSTGEGLDDGGGSSVLVEDADACNPPEVPDLCIPPLKKKKRKSVSNSVDAEQKGGKGDELKQGVSSGPSGGSELDAKPIKMKKRKRDYASDYAGQNVVDDDNSTGGPEANEGIGEVAMEQDIPNCGFGINDSDASHDKKKKKKSRHQGSDDAGHGVVDYGNSAGGPEVNGTIGEDDVGNEMDISNSNLGITDSDANPPKKKKKGRNRKTDVAERDFGDNGNSEGGRAFNEGMGSGNSTGGRGSNEGIGEGDVAIQLDVSKGGLEMNISDARPPTETRKKKGGNRETNIAEQDMHDSHKSEGGHEVNDDMRSGDSDTHASDSASKKKKRKGGNQDCSEDMDFGHESGSKGNMESKALESIVSPSKGESRRKKTVRFQEPAEDEPDENVTYMPLENDTDYDSALLSENRNWKKDLVREDLLYGRFTKDDDEKIKKSVFKYIKMRGWDEKEGLQTVLRSSHHADSRGCWLEIAKCLPIRPVKQINSRAYRILGGHKRGKWSAEELQTLTNLQREHGSNWKKIAAHMDRSADVLKDKWRHLKLVPTRKTGSWAQDEYDKLCKLVRRSLSVKASLPSKSFDRRQIRDDINWEWIAGEIQRDSTRCAAVWYEMLASPMISTKKWANGDDHLLLQRLMELGAASEEALDWDTILDHRDGEVCMVRWKEMTRLLGKNDHVSFEDKLELLAKRYAPDLLGIEEE